MISDYIEIDVNDPKCARIVWFVFIAGQLNANMQHNRANGDTNTKIGVMTP